MNTRLLRALLILSVLLWIVDLGRRFVSFGPPQAPPHDGRDARERESGPAQPKGWVLHIATLDLAQGGWDEAILDALQIPLQEKFKGQLRFKTASSAGSPLWKNPPPFRNLGEWRDVKRGWNTRKLPPSFFQVSLETSFEGNYWGQSGGYHFLQLVFSSGEIQIVGPGYSKEGTLNFPDATLALLPGQPEVLFKLNRGLALLLLVEKSRFAEARAGRISFWKEAFERSKGLPRLPQMERVEKGAKALGMVLPEQKALNPPLLSKGALMNLALGAVLFREPSWVRFAMDRWTPGFYHQFLDILGLPLTPLFLDRDRALSFFGKRGWDPIAFSMGASVSPSQIQIATFPPLALRLLALSKDPQKIQFWKKKALELQYNDGMRVAFASLDRKKLEGRVLSREAKKALLSLRPSPWKGLGWPVFGQEAPPSLVLLYCLIPLLLALFIVSIRPYPWLPAPSLSKTFLVVYLLSWIIRLKVPGMTLSFFLLGGGMSWWMVYRWLRSKGAHPLGERVLLFFLLAISAIFALSSIGAFPQDKLFLALLSPTFIFLFLLPGFLIVRDPMKWKTPGAYGLFLASIFSMYCLDVLERKAPLANPVTDLESRLGWAGPWILLFVLGCYFYFVFRGRVAAPDRSRIVRRGHRA